MGGVDGKDSDEEVGWATISKALKHAREFYRFRHKVRETREMVQWEEFPWQSQEYLNSDAQHTYFQKPGQQHVPRINIGEAETGGF